MRQIVKSKDADDPSRVPERRDLGEERRLDVLSGDEQLDRFDTGRNGRVHKVFALGDEQPELVAPAPVVELADELEPLVVAGGDQAGVNRKP